MSKKLLPLLLLIVFLSACKSSLSGRIESADHIALNAGMQKKEIDTGSFILTSYYKITDKNAPVSVYIEGDGFAWVTRRQLSSNPTPLDAFTLKLAALDPAKNVVYIARPCQYTSFEKDKLCEPKYWSGSRFSEKVVDSVNKTISYYAKSFPKPEINIIGYSGGAAVAVLVAARRSDIVTLRTVAGNLDHDAVNRYHKVEILKDSLNSIDVAAKLASLPQHHFAGGEDKIIPLSVVEAFAQKSGRGNNCVRVTPVKGATHYSGWQENWKELLAQPVSCSPV